MRRTTKNSIRQLTLIFLVAAVLTSVVLGVPIGPGMDYITTLERTSNSGTLIENSSHVGGTINTLQLDADQQNPHWKAYVGNITGTLSLDDANNYTIFSWDFGTLSGEVYATRATSVTWNNVSCATTEQIDIEMAAMNHTSTYTPTDNISATMDDDANNHASFWAGPTEITTNSCPYTTNLFQNDTNPGSGVSVWEEVVLFSSLNNATLFVSIISENTSSYRNGTDYDYQIILPEKGEPSFSGATTYYFYVELS